jgi:hypothetical protein
MMWWIHVSTLDDVVDLNSISWLDVVDIWCLGGPK